MSFKMRSIGAVGGAALLAAASVLAATPANAATDYLIPPTTDNGDLAQTSGTRWNLYKVTPTSTADITRATAVLSSAPTGYSLIVFSDSGGSVGATVGTLSQSNSGSATAEFTGSVTMCTGSTYWVGVRGVGGSGPLVTRLAGAQSSPWTWATGASDRAFTTDSGATYAYYSALDFGSITLSGDPSVATCSGGGSSSGTATVDTLSIASTAAGASCTGGNPSGVTGSWLTLPSADQCTPTGTSVKAGAKLLGWSTSANFPVAQAQTQVDKRWGASDETIDGVRMIFIPAGMATFLSGSNTLYPIWSN